MGRPAACGCGECTKCKKNARMRAWYRRGNNAEKARESARQSRLRRIEKVRAYDRSRGFRGTPEKTFARNAQRVLKRQPCEVCGVLPADAHHEDYSKPLDVRWLCEPHHAEVHRMVA